MRVGFSLALISLLVWVDLAQADPLRASIRPQPR
ncbi:MAG: hypothetical protein ACI861_001275, partial [Paracoccaceae bacterium]